MSKTSRRKPRHSRRSLQIRTGYSVQRFCGWFATQPRSDLAGTLSALDRVQSIAQPARVDLQVIEKGVADISAEQDPTLKSLKLASLCSALWRERGVELVVVGGSAIEFLTDGAYASGDLDLCHTTAATLPIRDRQELMGQLGAKGGPRNWQVAGMFLDLLGPAESFARTPYRKLEAPYGQVVVMKAEDLLVERVLVSVYPESNPAARDCARKLAAVALGGGIDMNWNEVKRVADLPEYRNLSGCATLVREVANELKIQSPLDSD